MSALTVVPIGARDAAAAVIEHHYLHRRPPISHAYGLLRGIELMGVVTYGTPASRHLQKSACPTQPGDVIELNRLWVADEMPRNTESWFVSRTLADIPPRIVVSYADLAQGHIGYVYRALNFNYAGWTDMDRKTPRFDYIPHQPGAHSREAMRSGWVEKRRRLPKVRYWITTGTRCQRKALAARCGWPALDWRTMPPPPVIDGRAAA